MISLLNFQQKIILIWKSILTNLIKYRQAYTDCH